MKKDNPTSRDLQAAERRIQLLEAAKKLFAQSGYHATTTRKITSEIGMADGLLYHYFPNGKKQILDTIIQGFVDERWKQIEQEMAEITPDLLLEKALRKLGNIMFHYIGTDKSMLMILMREQNILSDQYSETFKHHIKSVIQKTAYILQSKAEMQEIRSLNFFMMANQFCSSIYIYILQSALFGENNFYSLDPEAYLQSVVEYSLETWRI